MSAIILKFIRDKSVTSSPLELVQWDATGDIAYVPNVAGDWVVPPTGALEGLDELAQRVTDLSPLTVEAKAANFTAANNKVYLVTGAVNVQLPAPVSGLSFFVKLLGTDDVVLVRNAGEKIETVVANYTLISTRQSVKLISDGTDWFII